MLTCSGAFPLVSLLLEAKSRFFVSLSRDANFFFLLWVFASFFVPHIAFTLIFLGHNNRDDYDDSKIGNITFFLSPGVNYRVLLNNNHLLLFFMSVSGRNSEILQPSFSFVLLIFSKSLF